MARRSTTAFRGSPPSGRTKVKKTRSITRRVGPPAREPAAQLLQSDNSCRDSADQVAFCGRRRPLRRRRRPLSTAGSQEELKNKRRKPIETAEEQLRKSTTFPPTGRLVCLFVDSHLNKMRGNSLRSSRPANSMDQDSFDSFDDIEEMVMATNNLNLSPNPSETNRDSLNVSGEEDELPKSIIVTNVDLTVFDNADIKANFETMFREFEPNPTFHYLRSFRRVRVDFEAHLSASRAKLNLDGSPLGDNVIHCYFMQVLSPCTDEDAYLHVPPLEKQFLISPPASPPVGWEQPKEDRPVVDYDLLTAMASLTPGEDHELQPAKQVTMLGKSISTPSIVVQVCGSEEAAATGLTIASTNGRRIKATKCPDRQNSLD